MEYQNIGEITALIYGRQSMQRNVSAKPGPLGTRLLSIFIYIVTLLARKDP